MTDEATAYDHSFGAALRQCRKRAGKKLAELAAVLNVSVPYLSDVERGNRAPFTTERIKVIADFLGTLAIELMITAAESRGRFELDATISEAHREAGALLMRAWASLPHGKLEQLRLLVSDWSAERR